MADVKSSPLNTFSLLFGLIGIIIGLLIGLGAARLLPQKSNDNSMVSEANKKTENGIFTSESATLSGKVIQIDENSITVQKGSETAKFDLNKPIFISKPSTLARAASPSGDIKTVPLNEFATLNLQKIAGKYKVTTISLLPAVGSPAPIPSNFPLTSPPAP